MRLFRERVLELELSAAGASQRLEEVLSGAERLILSYERHGSLAAQTLYWGIATLSPQSPPLIGDVESVLYFALAYREPAEIVAFATNPYSGTLHDLLSAGRLTGHRITLLTPKPQDSRVASLLSSHSGVFFLEGLDEVESSVVMAIAAFRALSRLFRGSLEARGKRLHSHAEEGFGSIVEDMIGAYVDQLARLLSEERVVATSTRLLEPAAELFVTSLRVLGRHARFERPELIDEPASIVMLHTSVEDKYASQLALNFAKMGSRVLQLRMNTDPLEAPIYFGLLAAFLNFLKRF